MIWIKTSTGLGDFLAGRSLDSRTAALSVWLLCRATTLKRMMPLTTVERPLAGMLQHDLTWLDMCWIELFLSVFVSFCLFLSLSGSFCLFLSFSVFSCLFLQFCKSKPYWAIPHWLQPCFMGPEYNLLCIISAWLKIHEALPCLTQQWLVLSNSFCTSFFGLVWGGLFGRLTSCSKDINDIWQKISEIGQLTFDRVLPSMFMYVLPLETS